MDDTDTDLLCPFKCVCCWTAAGLSEAGVVLLRFDFPKNSVDDEDDDCCCCWLLAPRLKLCSLPFSLKDGC